MAIKHGRESLTGSDREERYTRASLFRKIPAEQRLIVIYGGILVFCVVMLVLYSLGLNDPLKLGPVQQGTAHVLGKTVQSAGTPEEARILTLSMTCLGRPGGALPPTAPVRVDDVSWKQAKVGMKVHVTFRSNPNQGRIVVSNLRVINEPKHEQPAEDVVPETELEQPAEAISPEPEDAPEE